MDKEPSIKIFVTYKEKHKILKSDIITPIQTGRAIADEVFEGMIGDNTGDNISDKNPKYSELSAQYWVWKNYDKIGNPDYVGFMHYRRHFIFNNKNYKPNALGCVEFESLSDEYIDEINLYKDKNIIHTVQGNEIIVGNKIDCRKFPFLSKPTPREAFRWNEDLNVEDYDLMNQTVIELYPNYKETVEKIEKGYTQYWYNMFIMNKNTFMEYSVFWYNIVSRLEEKINADMYGENAHRILGYLSERILSIFVIHQIEKGKKVKELRLSYLKNTNTYDEIKPFFKKNYIPIVLISSDYFLPYLATTVSSIKLNASRDFNYDIVILTRDMLPQNRKKIHSLYSDKNFCIRFVDVPFNKDFATGGHVSIETYMRITIPKLFRKYERVLYLDCDLIVNKDVKYFSTVSFEDNLIAAVKDCTLQSFVNNTKRDDKSYIQKKLKIQDPYSLFNGGVLLFNIKKLPADFEDVMYNLLDGNNYRYFDQDPLNIYFNKKVLYLPLEWNATVLSLFDISIKCLPWSVKADLQNSLKNPGIIHYNSNIKPWTHPDEPYADIWWSYARQTPFYEEILARLMDFKISQKPQSPIDLHVIYMLLHPLYFKLKKIWYKIKKKIGSKSHRHKYKEKYKKLKEELKEAKKLKNKIKKV